MWSEETAEIILNAFVRIKTRVCLAYCVFISRFIFGTYSSLDAIIRNSNNRGLNVFLGNNSNDSIFKEKYKILHTIGR